MSLQSEELAYDTANIVYKRVGPTYDKWWMKEGYGQNYAWVVAEHSDYSVRLFFEFMDTGFCYVKVHFTNGAAYEDLIADSWNYAKESPEYPFEETCDHVRNFLDNFFEVGGGMDKLRAKYEKGNNMYDVDSYTERDGYIKNSRKSSRRPIKSSDANHTYEEYKGNLFDLEEHLKWFDDNKVNREIASYFGKENVKKFYDLTAGADVSTDGYCIKLIYPNGEEFDVKSNNGMYELWYIGEDRVMHKLASISHYAPERFLKVLGRALPYTQERRDAEDPLNSSRRPVKSSDKPWKGKKWDIYRPGVDEPYVTEDFDEMMRFKQDGFKVKLHKEESINQSFVVGKIMNDGSKLYYCEDNCFYDENNYTRPSIKIFDNNSEAEKIAKRSKTGFVQEL